MLGAGAVAGVAVVSVTSDSSEARDPCEAAAHELDELWNENARGVMQRGFQASGHGLATSYYEYAAKRLDEFADRWTTLSEETCRLERAESRPSGVLLTRRKTCLDFSRVELESTVEMFARPSAKLVGDYDRVLPSMATLELCASDELLLTALAPPPPPHKRDAVVKIRRQLQDARSIRVGGDASVAAELLRTVVAAARELDHPPTESEALSMLGGAYVALQESELALEAFEAAALAADRGGADLARAAALERVARKLASLSRYDDARRALAESAAALDRAGVQAGVHRSTLLVGRAWVEEHAGEIKPALALYRQAAEQLGTETEEVDSLVTALDGAGRTLRMLGRQDEAIASYREALAIVRDVYGEQNPQVAMLRVNIGASFAKLGDNDAAMESFSAAYDTRRAYLAEDDPRMAKLNINIAVVAFNRGRYEEALVAFERARRAAQRSDGDGRRTELIALANSASTLSRMGRYDEALQRQREVLELRAERLGEQHVDTIKARAAMGMTFIRLSRWAEAREFLLQALQGFEDSVGEVHGDVMWVLGGLNDVYLQAKDVRSALASVERAQHIADEIEPSHRLLCVHHFAQARTWKLARRPAEQYLEPARQAVRDCETAELDSEVTEVRAWLQKEDGGEPPSSRTPTR